MTTFDTSTVALIVFFGLFALAASALGYYALYRTVRLLVYGEGRAVQAEDRSRIHLVGERGQR